MNMPIIDPELLAKQPIGEIRKLIVGVGGDWVNAETKKDLMVRYAQLTGSQDVAEKIKKQMTDAGFAKEDKPIYVKQQKLTAKEIEKILKPFTDKGLKYKISPDGETWAMKFDTGRRLKYGKDRVPVIVHDSGSTTIPPKVLAQCAELLVQQKRKPKATDIADPDFVDEDAA